jgi:hypothetical protein
MEDNMKKFAVTYQKAGETHKIIVSNTSAEEAFKSFAWKNFEDCGISNIEVHDICPKCEAILDESTTWIDEDCHLLKCANCDAVVVDK